MSESHTRITSDRGVELIPVADPLVRDPDLRFSATIPVLGIATRFETNSPTVLRIVHETFGVWHALAHERHERDTSARVSIVVTAGDEPLSTGDAHVRVRHVSPGDGRLIIHSPGSIAISDPVRRDAIAYASTSLVSNAEQFRSELLEAMTLGLLSELDRHPVHAAAIAKQGRAVLFAAASGTGKSTLAYHCLRAGFALMAEDRVYLQLEPTSRVWGWPSTVRLRPDAAVQAGAGQQPATMRRGKVEIGLDSFAETNREGLVASDFVTCVLTRDGGPAMLEPLPSDALAHALTRQLAAGFDRFPARWPAVLRALSVHGGWRLNLSSDPMDALPFVHDLLRGVAA